MGKITGFREYKRAGLPKDPVDDRIRHFREFEKPFDEKVAHYQGARCMECGIPFCHGDTGCPLGNLIPEWNDLVYKGRWVEALDSLHATNNFPEFTGRLCPAPCESACVLGLTEPPVSIKGIERTIIQKGFEEGLVAPRRPKKRTGKRVAIVGSGPAGLAAAQQLARAGHEVTVYEKNDRIGGLLRYGIPDFKLEKWIIDRRMGQMELEGVRFRTGVNVGVDKKARAILDEYDAMVIATGSEEPFDIPIKGRHLKGIHFAMEFLVQQNRVIAGDTIEEKKRIIATDKNILVVGGGDTGSDCVGTSNRQGARSIKIVRRSEKPGDVRSEKEPWPFYPEELNRTTSSFEEGVEREFGVLLKEFVSDGTGRVKSVRGARGKRNPDGKFQEIEGTDFEWEADLVLIAMGYRRPIHPGLLDELKSMGLRTDPKGNVEAPYGKGGGKGNFTTSVPRVYTCGDARRGQSLIVWAIDEGRRCAETLHRDLMASV